MNSSLLAVLMSLAESSPPAHYNVLGKYGPSKKTVIIPNLSEPHYTREGKPVYQYGKTVGGKKKRFQAKVHRGVSNDVYRARVNAVRRKAMGRYVGVFGFPEAA